jgi:site-specific DNA-adenine methylase
MSLISYFGSKSSNDFVKHLINPNIPKNNIKTYIEPFSGSFATFMDDPDMVFENVIFNDINKHQANLYKCAATPDKLLDSINKLLSTGGILYTNETDVNLKWDFYKSVYREYTKNDFLDNKDFELGDFERAAIYAFLITSSFSSVYPRGGGFSGYIKKQDKLKLSVLINKLKKNTYTDKLNSITHWYSTDFEELIKKYDSESTYIYLDPPYARFNGEKDDDSKRLFWYGADADGVFGPASHRRLIELIKTTKSKWSLSYYYFPLLDELLPREKYRWIQRDVVRRSAMGGNNHQLKGEQLKGTELLIMNYDENFNKI